LQLARGGLPARRIYGTSVSLLATTIASTAVFLATIAGTISTAIPSSARSSCAATAKGGFACGSGAQSQGKEVRYGEGQVYTEDDLSSLKGSGVSVVGEAPKKGARPSRPLDPDGDGGQNNEEYWRRRAREILDQITAVDEEIAQKKDEIKKYGSGGFDVTTGMKQNIAYINDRNGQVKSLENRKVNLEKQLDDLQEEGRKAGAAPSWFR